LKKMKLVVHGDIGCYALGVVPPLSAIDTIGCMGASIAVAHGALAAGAPAKTVAVIGDSTFFHAGLPALVDVVYNNGAAVTVIVDNGTTAMTGHQDHPSTGKTLGGRTAPVVSIENVVRAIGVEDVAILDAYDLPALEKAIKRGISGGKPAVVIARHPCVLQVRQKAPPLTVNEERCNLCGLCLNLGCQAIVKGEASVTIDPVVCIGCEVCWQTCARKAILKAEESAQ
jgi:indolepyruvate ferredoxin oxidoreductase alpha subunit